MKKIIIMRGVSGSGKSTRAKQLAEQIDNAVICSADQFFMQDGIYDFNPALLGLAHEDCLNRAIDAMTKGNCVIIDNTNTQAYEYEKYVEQANKFGYEVRFEVIGQLDIENLKLYAKRNIHGVSLDILKKQANRIKENL